MPLFEDLKLRREEEMNPSFIYTIPRSTLST
jgi:hypothetical protein